MTSKAQKKRGYIIPTPIDGYPLVCATLSIPNAPHYRGAFLGALMELTKWWNWEKSYEAGDTRAVQASSYWHELIRNTLVVGDCEGEFPPDLGECVSYPTSAWFIDWAPQNPFAQPNFTPPGYLLPPWQVVTAENILAYVGYQIGDVLTDITRVPLIVPPDGWPRFRINLHGEGTVELHLLNVPIGSYAQVQLDGLLATLTLVELNMDTTSVPPETNQVIVHEVTVTGDTDHFVDVSIIPRFDDSAPFSFFGGGIRKVVLCGFDQTGVDMPAPQFQVVDCLLQWRPDMGAAWEPLQDLSVCIPDDLLWRLPDSAARNLIYPTANHSGLGIKRRLGQTAELFPIYDENDVMKVALTKDFDFQMRGMSATVWNTIMSRGMFGFNLRQVNTGAIERLNTAYAGFGWCAQSVSDNFMHLYAQRPSGSLLQLLTFFVSSDAANSSLTFRPRMLMAGALSGAAFAWRSQAATRVTTSSELVSGQSVDLHQNLEPDGVTVRSGCDKYAYYFMRTSAGAPSQTDAKIGAIAVDTTSQTIWVKYASGWVQFQQVGPQGEQGIQGIQGIPGSNAEAYIYHSERARPAAGETDTINVVVRADEYLTLPWLVYNGDQISIEQVGGWWTDEPRGAKPGESPVGYEATGRRMFSGTPGTFDTDVADPYYPSPHMALIIYYHSFIAPNDRFSEIPATINIENDSPVPISLEPNCTTLDGNVGAIQAIVSLTSANYDICREINLAINRMMWHVIDNSSEVDGINGTIAGNYVLGTGFATTLNTGTQRMHIKPTEIDPIEAVGANLTLSIYATIRTAVDNTNYSEVVIERDIDGTWASESALQVNPGETFAEHYMGQVTIPNGSTLEGIAIYINRRYDILIEVQKIRMEC